MDQTQLMGLEFGIFGGFWWVRSSVLVDKPSSVFPYLGLDFGPFLDEQVRSSGFLEGFE